MKDYLLVNIISIIIHIFSTGSQYAKAIIFNMTKNGIGETLPSYE